MVSQLTCNSTCQPAIETSQAVRAKTPTGPLLKRSTPLHPSTALCAPPPRTRFCHLRTHLMTVRKGVLVDTGVRVGLRQPPDCTRRGQRIFHFGLLCVSGWLAHSMCLRERRQEAFTATTLPDVTEERTDGTCRLSPEELLFRPSFRLAACCPTLE
ncbi:hypothetical protein DPEC_G00183310 [Dallia pectoralis]|uniref:Uncharacterized protein n=1 Tax=Dallia pectoralis TaxID=75939 RepID=A0ACC2GAS6_DALPE|nr:hypothetical protein DPEC_G00183310 [Dallia pectoralis]